jgi:hypothetical protein
VFVWKVTGFQNRYFNDFLHCVFRVPYTVLPLAFVTILAALHGRSRLTLMKWNHYRPAKTWQSQDTRLCGIQGIMYRDSIYLHSYHHVIFLYLRHKQPSFQSFFQSPGMSSKRTLQAGSSHCSVCPSVDSFRNIVTQYWEVLVEIKREHFFCLFILQLAFLSLITSFFNEVNTVVSLSFRWHNNRAQCCHLCQCGKIKCNHEKIACQKAWPVI